MPHQRLCLDLACTQVSDGKKDVEKMLKDVEHYVNNVMHQGDVWHKLISGYKQLRTRLFVHVCSSSRSVTLKILF